MNLKDFKRVTKNKFKEMNCDLEIWGGSGWAKLNYNLVEKFNLEQINKISVFSCNDLLVFVFGKNEDKKMIYNSGHSRGVYLKDNPELNGKYKLMTFETDKGNNKVYLKFKKMEF